MASSVLLVVWACFFCDYVLMTLAIPIFPLLGKSDEMTGMLFAAKATLQILSSPFFVNLVDYSAKTMLLVGLVLETMSLCLFASTFSFEYWLAARGISGVASAAIIAAGFAILQHHFTNLDERANVMGIATTGIIAGVCLGPLWGGFLYEISPQLPFSALAAAELLLFAVAFSCLPAVADGQLAAPTEASIQHEASAVSMLKCPQLLRPLGALLFANAGIACLESTSARYFSLTFGFHVWQTGAAYLLTSGPSCLTSGLAGPAGKRIGRTQMVCIGLFLQGLFTMAGPKDVLWVEAVTFVLLGVGMGIIDGTVPAILGELSDSKFGGSGKIYVLSNVATQLGFMMGPVLGSAAVEAWGFAVCMACCGAAMLLYIPVFTGSFCGIHFLSSARCCVEDSSRISVGREPLLPPGP
eukprot:TRINITY_DN24061_c0_g1_i1.p1 TRINITY_DN24061_c0_g1~~TRINITY_DN24061_c0_g1_i1.p1  ORF type:complete len:412 (-),score=56.35 TRINITY_DN24061_c0_g1_i1:88-1323(-)